MVAASDIADHIKQRTQTHLRRIQPAAVSSKPIVMRAEYVHCPNLTIIDTPVFVCKAMRGEPELIDGTADPDPDMWGKTTEEELLHSGIGSWPGINMSVKPANSTLKLYGGAAFTRVMDEFHCATYSLECPQVSREKVANILLDHAGRDGSCELAEVAAEIACAAAQSRLVPLIDAACDRLAFVLQSLFDIAMERNHNKDSQYQNVEDMDGSLGFLAALRCLYCKVVKELSKQCKQILRHHLDSVTSPYSHIGYENGSPSGFGSVANSMNRMTSSDSGSTLDIGSKSGSSYSTICAMSAIFFAKMREALIERIVPSALNDGFLSPRRGFYVALCLELCAADDDKFKEMFGGVVDIIQNERQSLINRQKSLLSCLNDFKNISGSCNDDLSRASPHARNHELNISRAHLHQGTVI